MKVDKIFAAIDRYRDVLGRFDGDVSPEQEVALCEELSVAAHQFVTTIPSSVEGVIGAIRFVIELREWGDDLLNILLAGDGDKDVTCHETFYASLRKAIESFRAPVAA